MTILQAGYEGTDTAITSFEAQLDGATKSVKASEIDGWYPTYLNPFVPPKTIYLRDLPEGTYNFALRAIDMAGNKSEWSKVQKVTVRADEDVPHKFVVGAMNACVGAGVDDYQVQSASAD